MKLLRSTWVLAILAILLHAGALAGIVSLRWEAILHPQAAAASTPVKRTPLPPRLWTFDSEPVDKLVEDLRAERARIAKRESELTQLQARVEAERLELEKVRADVVAIRDEISTTVTEIKTTEAENLRSLAKTYSALTPKAAVTILSQLDDAMVVKLLALMRNDKVALLLEEMARPRPEGEDMAKRAAQLSELLRLVRTPKEARS